MISPATRDAGKLLASGVTLVQALDKNWVLTIDGQMYITPLGKLELISRTDMSSFLERQRERRKKGRRQ